MVHLAGFGLGALNDAEDDDVDIYDAGFEKQSKGHLAYDMNEEMGDTLRFGSSKIEASQISVRSYLSNRPSLGLRKFIFRIARRLRSTMGGQFLLALRWQLKLNYKTHGLLTFPVLRHFVEGSIIGFYC